MLLNREQIAAMIPHGASMSLLDAVVAVDAHSITCVARRHLDADNPLKESGLGSWTLIEYGAQAAAVHQGMQAGGAAARASGAQARAAGSQTSAYIAQVKDIRITAPQVVDSVLTVAAECLVRDATAAAYQISVTAGTQTLLQGRITLALGYIDTGLR